MVITQTPLRISFAGGGTDLVDFYSKETGAITSSTIDKYVFVIVKERFDDQIVLNYSAREVVESVEEIEHDLIREALKITGIKKGVEITTLADIPSQGSGLGSSSAVTVGLLNALYAFLGEPQSHRVLAEQACEIEIERCGKPIGKQDQFAASFGGLRHITFAPNGVVETERIRLCHNGYHGFTVNGIFRKLGANILLFYTNKTRKADSILSEQKLNTVSKMDILRRMRDQAITMKECLEKGEIDCVGEILHEGWQLKKQLASTITNDEIEFMYDKALNAGALGGKIAGAGGGGFLMLYVLREKQNAVREALANYRELPFMLENDGSKVIFNYRRYDAK